jgi:5-methylcytosine-specific restriction endonuclease McrA
MISEFNRFFSSKSLASTYKPTFVKCLLDLGDFKSDEGSQWVKKDDNTITLDLNFVAVRFLRYYHPLKFKFKLKQEATPKTIAVYRILEEFKEIVGVKSTPSKKQLCEQRFSEIRQRTIDEGIKPQVLKKLLNDCKIYSINKGSNSIVIKNDVIEYMKSNKKILESALNHMIASYLEKCNSSPNISTKLEEKILRTTLSKDSFSEIIQMQDSCCFYCGKKGDDFAQEHFIPWNFLFDTQNFNIIASCNACNSSKNDRLADTIYLEKLLDRNDKLKKMPFGYSREFMKNLYQSCRIEYHGMEQKLWRHDL